MEPSRFWLRRSDDDSARQVVYDQLQLDRYTSRQRRAILKLLARGRGATHREVARAARRATSRPRGETPIAIALLVLAFAVLALSLMSGHRNPADSAAPHSGRPLSPASRATRPAGPTRAMDDADKAWLRDVGAGKIVTASDGSDAFSLAADAAPGRQPGKQPSSPQR